MHGASIQSLQNIAKGRDTQVAPLQDTPREQLLDEHSGLGRWVLRVLQSIDSTVEILCTRFISSALSPSKLLPRSVAWAANLTESVVF
jgi:hypothetical protein